MRICPICQTSDCSDAGPILHHRPHSVAGVPIELNGVDFRLRVCRGCRFGFKDPPIPEDKLLDCYARASEDNWGIAPDPHERKFDILRDLLVRHAPAPPYGQPRRRVLDVGCFNGALLAWLGDGWQTYGIEPSRSASALARERGVNVLGATLEDVPYGHAFEAILAIDVVEHILDPLPFFRRARDLLVPGGVLIIVTGDMHALSWRLHGSRYWYCSLLEHVSFYSADSIACVDRLVGLEPLTHLRGSHKRATLRQKASELVKNALFIVGSKVRWMGIGALRRRMDRRGPGWLSARDHLFHVARRP